MFKSIQRAVYSVRNKPVCEFKNWCVTTLLKGYVIYNSVKKNLSVGSKTSA